ncbi:hypothetical protein [Agromyces seonyuensis]|uniref:DUF1801 domain-containing protein n=1 Tax=Agromyces seonyuensis TaxID=2662446 RepID=A0A6I4P2E5_9MICO|nr:hypothetical protein [Agromyces seonyuensis]MWB98249.1 hypothetical protein [Agromyces seonyuensis]
MTDTRDTKTGFSDEERAAMQQRADELRTTKGLKGAAKLAKELEACVEAIDSLDGVDKEAAVLLNRIVAEEAPDLAPKTFYGFPAYASDGKVVVFYQPASKFKTRYGTFTFDEPAALDDGDMWAVSFAVLAVTDGVESRLRELVKRAVS